MLAVEHSTILSKTASKQRGKIDVEKALKMRVKGLSHADIGKVFGVTKQAVSERLKAFNVAIKDVADIPDLELAEGEIKKKVRMGLLLDMADPDRRKKATLNQTAFAYNTISNDIRLDAGQATEIVSSPSDALKALRDSKASLKAKRAEIMLKKGSDGVFQAVTDDVAK